MGLGNSAEEKSEVNRKIYNIKRKHCWNSVTLLYLKGKLCCCCKQWFHSKCIVIQMNIRHISWIFSIFCIVNYKWGFYLKHFYVNNAIATQNFIRKVVWYIIMIIHNIWLGSLFYCSFFIFIYILSTGSRVESVTRQIMTSREHQDHLVWLPAFWEPWLVRTLYIWKMTLVVYVAHKKNFIVTHRR